MGIQARLINRLPAGFRVHPLEGVIAILGIVMSSVSAIGAVDSRVLGAFPVWGALIWTASLFTGSSAWILGLLSTRVESFDVVTIRKVPLYTFGLTLVSGSMFIYGIAIVIITGWDSGLSSLSWFMLSAGTYARRAYLVSSLKGE